MLFFIWWLQVITALHCTPFVCNKFWETFVQIVMALEILWAQISIRQRLSEDNSRQITPHGNLTGKAQFSYSTFLNCIFVLVWETLVAPLCGFWREQTLLVLLLNAYRQRLLLCANVVPTANRLTVRWKSQQHARYFSEKCQTSTNYNDFHNLLSDHATSLNDYQVSLG